MIFLLWTTTTYYSAETVSNSSKSNINWYLFVWTKQKKKTMQLVLYYKIKISLKLVASEQLINFRTVPACGYEFELVLWKVKKTHYDNSSNIYSVTHIHLTHINEFYLREHIFLNLNKTSVLIKFLCYKRDWNYFLRYVFLFVKCYLLYNVKIFKNVKQWW